MSPELRGVGGGQVMVLANIVAMRSKSLGDYVYRVSQPASAMARQPGVCVVTVSVLSPWLEEVLLGADVAVLHLLSEDDLFPLLAERKRMGRPTVYEISDNFLESHPGVGIRGWFADSANRANALKLIEIADAVQVTGSGLRDRFAHLNPHTMILPNQVASLGQPPRAAGVEVRLGWAGSAGHTEDLLGVWPVISAVLGRCPRAVFSFMGNEQQFLRVFGGLPVERRRFSPAGSLEDYYRFLETLDVGIAPLLDNAYNQCRSDIKFVEYASRGVVPVLAAVKPYRESVVSGVTGFLFEDNAALEAILVRLIQEPELRAQVAGRAHAYVERERLEPLHAATRLAFYQGLGGRRGDEGPSSARPGVVLPEGELLDVSEHPAESLLVAGISSEGRGDSISAREYYRQAAEALPGYALPLFWHGRSHALRGEMRQAERKFADAVAINPRSVRAMIELGRAQTEYDENAARATFERALTLFPGQAAVVVAFGELAERTGRWYEAAQFYDHALALNRFSEAASEGRKRAWLRATSSGKAAPESLPARENS